MILSSVNSWAKAPLRLSPDSLQAKLSDRSLAVQKSEQGWRVGGVLIDAAKFKASSDASSSTLITIDWDSNFLKPQKMIIRQKGGEVLLQDDFEAGEYQLRGDKLSDLSLKSVGAANNLVIRRGQDFGLNTSTLEICLLEERPTASALVCASLAATAQRPNYAGGVVANNKTYLTSALIPFSIEQDIEFTLDLPSGLNLQFLIERSPSELYELTLDGDGNLSATIHSEKPDGPAQLMSPERSWLFQHTIGDLRKFYRLQVPMTAPFIYFVVDFDFRFQQKIEYQDLAQLDKVPDIGPLPLSTYRDQIVLRGNLKEFYDVKPGQNEVTASGREFQWVFMAPTQGQYNVAKLTLLPFGKTKPDLVFDSEVYRGYATYLSARLGASLTAKLGFSGAADLNLYHWFEEPLGQSPTFSRLRWGTNLGFATTAFSTDPLEKYQIFSATGMYRFSPGVESWDETIGAWIGFMNLSYRDTNAVNVLGGGLFLSRSLPTWSNYFVGIFEFFRRPKWFNLSVGAFPMSLDSKVKAWTAEAKAVGRIDLSPQTYFEGGWAIVAAQYSYDLNNGRVEANMAAGRAYFGYGYRF